ncbi:MAG: PKD domain-containing protein [Chitinophagaceae bacterium]|nr:PKD domain-containing protein [Chitinophagaceae bacterium]
MNSRIFLRVSLLLAITAASFIADAQTVASFSATPISGCSPLIVRFTDESTGNPTQWRWDLGNGTISFLQHPSAIYFSPGKYAVKLVVQNAGGADSVIKTDYVEVFGKPIVQFSSSDTTGCYPLPVQFTDASIPVSGGVTSWLWDFGDGSTSTLQNPSHVYTSARNFSVTLQIRNSSGCVSTLTKQSMIQISTGVLAQFTNDNPQTCTAPVTINFQNQSTGTGAVTYLWDLGDGSTSDLLNPSHTYTTNGTYTVKLIVTNSNGCSDTIIKPNAVTIGSVNAGFNAAPSGCQNSAVQFTNTSAPAPASVFWTFGDGSTSTSLDPIKSYATAGTYTVKMVANFGACIDSTIKTITILPKPRASFTTTDTANCKTPYTVNFTNHSINAASYLWDFGDNATSTAVNPSHTYSNIGSFSVKLVVTGANGCTDTLIKANYINIKKPSTTITNIPDSGCVPFTKTFNLNVTTTDPVTSYWWNFGDGNTSSSASPTNIYSLEGIYNVSVIILTANGCTDTARVTKAIITNNKPVANFSASPTNTCANSAVTFSDLSTGGPSRWLWDFGDSTTSSLQNPSHQYLDTGYFNIRLKIWKGGCTDSITMLNYIHINPPVAKFKTTNDCKKPLERVFTDQSIGADEWHWDFGDGNTSTLQSPVHLYASAGTFVVSLRVVNNTYGCDFTATKQIQIINAKAQFTAIDTSVCKGANVLFNTGLSLSDILYLNWNFGDGSPNINSPRSQNYMEHIYSRTGRFNVRLIMSDILGCTDTLIRFSYISVSGPTAKFSPAVAGACSNNAVIFNDSTATDGTHPIQQWEWNYGDSTTETLTTPPFQHFYSTPGAYIVKLKVTDSKGCADSVKLNTALVISKPKANFTSVDTFSCPGKPVRFVNQSTGPSLTYRWYFGDNTNSNSQNPSHIYGSDGTYSVKLVVTDLYGCSDSVLKTTYISIKSPLSMFTMSDSASNCPPLVVNFTDQSTNTVSKKWDFGDSTYSTEANPTHFYNYPGTYFPKLTITGQGGCTNTYLRKVVIKGPEGVFTYTPLKGCNPVTVNFSASTTGNNSFVWDFNDGSTMNSNNSSITYTYTYPGSYIPKMILIDQTGCQVPITGDDTIVVSSVNTNFSFTNKLLCDSGIISFSDSSIFINDVISTYEWNFGDGTTSASQNPVHQYNTTGIFYPSLVAVTQQGCTDTLKSAVPVKIVASPQINIASTSNGCAPLAVTFNSQMVLPDTSAITWQWTFANGNTSTAAAPAVQNYTTAGLYNVTLIGTNSSGCKDSATKTMEAYAIPTVSAGADFILCKGSSRTLQASGADTYTWSPATGLSCSNCTSPSTTTDNNISYFVRGTSAQGCSASDTVAVTVKTKLTITHSSNDSLCKGQSKKLTAAGANTYSWTPTNSLSNATASEPVATPDTTTTYRVVGTDDVGCFKDTGYISIRVNPLPTVEAGLDKTINVGHTIDLIPEISPDVTQVIWSPTTGLFRNFYPGVTVKPTENTEYTVDVKNRGGCAARDRVTVFVICNGANIFIPNTFSPNADGTNDVFYPRGTGVFKIKSLRLYTRWGELIFEKSNFDANNPAYGWNGTNKGMQLTPDVFVYTLEVVCDNGSVLTHRGNIALIK